MTLPVVLQTEAADLGGYFRDRVDLRFEPSLASDPVRLRQALTVADGLIVRNQTTISDDTLSGARRLRVIGRLGAGVDNIDVQSARARGIEVVYAPDANSAAVAEYCVAQIINMTRDLGSASAITRLGGWERDRFIGRELSELTVGILGLGRVGSRVASILTTLGARVTATRHSQSPERSTSAELVGFEELLNISDVVSIHLPLTAETNGLIDRKALRLFKAGASLVNTSRGAVVDEEAVFDALRSGRLSAATLDVRHSEPPRTAVPNDVPNLTLTPHIAAFTFAAQDRVGRTVADDVTAVLDGRHPQNPVP